MSRFRRRRYSRRRRKRPTPVVCLDVVVHALLLQNQGPVVISELERLDDRVLDHLDQVRRRLGRDEKGCVPGEHGPVVDRVPEGVAEQVLAGCARERDLLACGEGHRVEVGLVEAPLPRERERDQEERGWRRGRILQDEAEVDRADLVDPGDGRKRVRSPVDGRGNGWEPDQEGRVLDPDRRRTDPHERGPGRSRGPRGRSCGPCRRRGRIGSRTCPSPWNTAKGEIHRSTGQSQSLSGGAPP